MDGLVPHRAHSAGSGRPILEPIITALAALLLAACSAGAPGAAAQALPGGVQLNQVGFLPDAGKHAIVVTDSATPLSWTLHNAEGQSVADGVTSPFGLNAGSAQNVHQIDFGGFRTPGAGYTLRVGDSVSHPFDIASDLYRRLKYDA